jgi:hypothetical protein
MGKIKLDTLLLQTGKTTTGIQVPDDVVEKLNAGKKPPVSVTINGYTYRSSIAVMGGVFMLGVSADVREHAKVNGGDEITVYLELDTKPREVELPDDFKAALDGNKKAKAFFESVSYSVKQRYILPVGQAKTEETRQRRIEKAISDLSLGKK